MSYVWKAVQDKQTCHLNMNTTYFIYANENITIWIAKFIIILNHY